MSLRDLTPQEWADLEDGGGGVTYTPKEQWDRNSGVLPYGTTPNATSGGGPVYASPGSPVYPNAPQPQSQAQSLMPILLVGGAVLLIVAMGGKGRR